MLFAQEHTIIILDLRERAPLPLYIYIVANDSICRYEIIGLLIRDRVRQQKKQKNRKWERMIRRRGRGAVFAHFPIKYDACAWQRRPVVCVFAWNNKGAPIVELILRPPRAGFVAIFFLLRHSSCSVLGLRVFAYPFSVSCTRSFLIEWA